MPNSKTSNLQGQSGFSLIEVLVVTLMLAILAATVVNQFFSYKRKAYNATAQSDLKNALSSQEAYYAENLAYLPCSDVSSCETTLPNFVGTKSGNGDPACDIFNFTVTGDTLTGTSKHKFSNRTFVFDSSVGGSITGTDS